MGLLPSASRLTFCMSSLGFSAACYRKVAENSARYLAIMTWYSIPLGSSKRGFGNQ